MLPTFLGDRIQLAFVVSNLNDALKFWTETLRVGPFVVIENSVAGRTVIHRGERTSMNTTLAFSYLGDIQIELVCPEDAHPSPFNDFLNSGRQGLQHIAFWPKNFEEAREELESHEFVEACSMYLPDGSRNVCYYDAPSEIGLMIEIVPLTAERSAYFGRIQKLARDWDGARPVRRFKSREDFLASEEGVTKA
jgi:catechol 2,3-dioxygenase-like lactoylglutathione lyase family enzyme